jgi:hypothetical protein
MERLKAILADKILDLSSVNGDDVKMKVDKMQRFRDFANACQTLMKKYPAIEDELIKMVEDGDFDTKVASSRVDSVIRLADTEAAQSDRIIIPQIPDAAMTKEEPVTIPVPGAAESAAPNVSADAEAEPRQMPADDIPMEIVEPEDTDYEEVPPSDEEEAENGYVPYEVVHDDEKDETLSHPEEDDEPEMSEEERAAHRKMIVKRILQVAGIVVAVVAIIFIVKFVIAYWQIILIIIGVVAVLAILYFFRFKRKR